MAWKRGEAIIVSRDEAFGEGGEFLHVHNPDLRVPARRGAAHSVIADPSGDGFICVGVSVPEGQRVGVLVVLQISSTGEVRNDVSVLPPGGDVTWVTSAVIDSEGALVVAGKNRDLSPFLVRMLPDRGTIDSRYGANFQTWRETVRSHGQGFTVVSLQPLPGGNMLLAGGVARREGLQALGPFVARLNADGTPDDGFRKYGGPPKDGSTFDWVFHDVGCLPDGTIVTGGKFVEPDYKFSIGNVVFLDGDGTPFEMQEQWLGLLNVIHSVVPDTLTGGLVLGGFRQQSQEVWQACAVRMLPDGRPDFTASGGGLWKTASRASVLNKATTTSSGAILGVGQKMPNWTTLLEINPDGTPASGLGPTGMAPIANEPGVVPAGVCVSGDQAVVALRTEGNGFVLRSYRVGHVRTAPPPAPKRSAQVDRVAAERQAAVARVKRSVDAQIAGNKWIEDSNANMATSTQMMNVAMMNLSRW